jgi:hypothetical protein
MSHTGDIRKDPGSDVPFLGRIFYQDYEMATLQFVDQALEKAAEFLPELFPGIPSDAVGHLKQAMMLERLVKFCHIAENVGAIAIAFKPSYDDEKQEILGIFETLSTYEVGDVVNFYREIGTQKLQYVARFAGYPFLHWQTPDSRKTLEMSCQNLKEDLAEIGVLYDELRFLYDAYKHGYRVAFGKQNATRHDVIVYVDKNKKEKVLVLTDELKKSIGEKLALCFHVLSVIFKSHRERVRFEATGTREGPSIVTIYRRRTDPKPGPEALNVKYPTRGEMLKEEIEAANRIYEMLSEELEREHPDEFIAIDIDEKKVVAMNSSMDKLKLDLQKNPPKGRFRFRHVEKKRRE